MLEEEANFRHYHALGDVSRIERTPRGLLLEVGSERFLAEVWRPDILRLALSHAGVFDEQPSFAVCGTPEGQVDFELREEERTITLSTSALSLTIRKQPFSLCARRRDGTLLFEDVVEPSGVSHGFRQLNDSFLVQRRIGPEDPIFGLGEKTGASNRRGRRFVLWNTDILSPGVLERNRLFESERAQDPKGTTFDPYYTSIPFFYHCRSEPDGVTAAAGFFFDNAYKGHFDFRQRDTFSVHFDAGHYTEYVFAGPSLREVLEAYTSLTGRMAPPPLWSLGHHQCRWKDYTQSEFLAVGEQYRSRQLPCDSLWLDIDYMEGYRVYTWSKARFPDVPRMLADCEASGFRVITIIDPGVKQEPGYAIFDQALEQNAFCKTEGKSVYIGHAWPGRTAFPDFSLERVRSFWARHSAAWLSQGISGIWNDMNEPATGDVEPFSMRFDRDGANHPHERFHNQYGLLMAMATVAGFRLRNPELRPFILSRAGSAGIQRYAAQWLGDNASTWPHLRMALTMSLGMGLSGQPFIGSDVPGFTERPTPELMARWMQYAALTPFCRCHNVRGEPDQYPWSFGPEIEQICRAALELRYRLLPYLYSAFWQASETGVPIQRPLALDAQHDRVALGVDDQFLLGDALLVAPVLEPGAVARSVYLPRGSWYEWDADRALQGARSIDVEAPLDRIPLYVRGGSVVATYAHAAQSTRAIDAKEAELHLYVPLEDGTFHSSLREDDGETRAFERGAFLRTDFELIRLGTELSVEARVTGRGYPEHRRMAYVLVVHGALTGLRLNGVDCALTNGRIRFENRGQGFSLRARSFSETRPSP
jgi:alpha-glucosidase